MTRYILGQIPERKDKGIVELPIVSEFDRLVTVLQKYFKGQTRLNGIIEQAKIAATLRKKKEPGLEEFLLVILRPDLVREILPFGPLAGFVHEMIGQSFKIPGGLRFDPQRSKPVLGLGSDIPQVVQQNKPYLSGGPGISQISQRIPDLKTGKKSLGKRGGMNFKGQGKR